MDKEFLITLTIILIGVTLILGMVIMPILYGKKMQHDTYRACVEKVSAEKIDDCKDLLVLRR